MLLQNVKSYAKINLGLNILSKRPDGFHELESVFQQISLADEIDFEIIPKGISVTTDLPSQVPDGEKNICYQAAKLLKDRFNVAQGIRIEIRKNIPVGAGLGGGSSNAAVVLAVLNHLWQLGLSCDELAALGAEIGSDVPFFISGGTMLARGRGEILSECQVPIDYRCALIFPNFSVSTVWAYKNFKINLTNIQKNIKLADVLSVNIKLHDFKKYFKNDLEAVVFQRYSELEQIKNSFYEIGAEYASMSGSGSSVFGLFSSLDAEVVLEKFSLNPEFRVFFVNPIQKNYTSVA